MPCFLYRTRPLPELRDLAAFASVARRKHFRRAAVDLGVSVSSPSSRVRSVEKSLGVPLLKRTASSVGVTEAGERLLARPGPALQDVDEAVASLQGSGAALTGRLGINAPPPVANLALWPSAMELLNRHPQVTIEIVAESSLVDIGAAGYDAGVRYEETLAQETVAAPLGPPQTCVLVASRSLSGGSRCAEVAEGAARATLPADAVPERTSAVLGIREGWP